jgi:hypothetical protein
MHLLQSEEFDYLIQNLRKAHQTNDLEMLGDLVEYARTEGIFYLDFEEKHAKLFNLLLTISLDLLHSPLVFQSNKLWWFIAECYDIHFHQIRLEEYPSDTATLFFELTRNVLQPDFHKLDLEKGSALYWYSTCIYFITMRANWFSSKWNEFFELYTLLQPWTRNALEDDLIASWIESYDKFTSGTVR